jgi:hypothetical protein
MTICLARAVTSIDSKRGTCAFKANEDGAPDANVQVDNANIGTASSAATVEPLFGLGCHDAARVHKVPCRWSVQSSEDGCA